jgi:hypothetical protein
MVRVGYGPVKIRATEIAADAEANSVCCDRSEGERHAQPRLVLKVTTVATEASHIAQRGRTAMRDTWT